MKYVKLFEEFNPTKERVFTYIVHNNSEKNFHAEVKDDDGKVIYEIKGTGLFEGDGPMKGKEDLSGLRTFLISKNKIKECDQIIPAGGGRQETQNFVQPINTNPVSNVNMNTSISTNDTTDGKD